MDVDVAAVPRREPGMVPAEVMTSESQERMLAIVAPAALDDVAGGVRALGGRRDGRRPGDRRRPGGDGGEPVGRLRIRDGLDGPVLADGAGRGARRRRAALRPARGADPTDLDARLDDDPTADEPTAARAARTSSASSSTPPRSTASTTTSCS